MSLILDALNKAEQDRKGQDGVPNLQASHGSLHTTKEPSGARRWLVEIVFVVLLIVGFGIYYITTSEAPKTTAPLSGAETRITPAAQTIPESRSQTTTLAVEPAMQSPQAAGALPAAGAQNVPTAPTESFANELANDRPPKLIKNAANVKSLYAQSEQLGRQGQPLKQNQVLQAEPKSANPAANRWLKIPLLGDLSRQAQNAIPSIDFSLHVYSAEQGTGFVTLNGNRLREGQQSGGLRLVKIEEEFIVLNHNGVEFRLLSLNSWVNFESGR